MSLLQIFFLAVIQGLAELLPVSSSAHVIIAEKFMGLDPSAPEMTFLLVMLHTGTMFAVLLYFWPRWRKWKGDFIKRVVLATVITGGLGLGLKKLIEKMVLGYVMGETEGEIEHLFKSLPLMSFSLFAVGLLIIFAGTREKKAENTKIDQASAIIIGIVQGLCLPFRGFSRSGATISTAMLKGISRGLAEDFSFALAVMITPPVIALQLHRLIKHSGGLSMTGADLGHLLLPGIFGALFSFLAGLAALRWLSTWLEQGKWKYFGIYCLIASLTVLGLHLSVFSNP